MWNAAGRELGAAIARRAATRSYHAHGLAAWGFLGGDSGAPLVMSVHGLEEFEVPAGPKRWAYGPFRRRIRRAAAAAAKRSFPRIRRSNRWSKNTSASPPINR